MGVVDDVKEMKAEEDTERVEMEEVELMCHG